MKKKITLILVAFILLVYVGYQIYISNFTGVKTQTVKYSTLSDSIQVESFVIRDEEFIENNSNGVLAYLLDDGEKISNGGLVAEVFKSRDDANAQKEIQNIEKEIYDLNRLTCNSKENLSSPIVLDERIEELIQKMIFDTNVSNYNNLSEEEKDSMMEESLKADYESKKELYNSAVADSNDTVDLDRSLQDTKDSLKIEEYNKELAKLQPLLDASGKIVSEKEGIVTSVVAENGGVTTDTIASIADKNEGYKFVGEIDKSNRTLVKQGQTVALNLGSSGIIENLTIDSISKSDDNPDSLKVTVVLPVGIGEIDESGEIIVSSKSKKYGTCVPLAALRQGDGDSYYILVVTEKETVLGEELTAKKVDVKVEKRDGEYAAVSDGSLGRNDKIIIDSNKTVEDGDRVRLESE